MSLCCGEHSSFFRRTTISRGNWAARLPPPGALAIGTGSTGGTRTLTRENPNHRYGLSHMAGAGLCGSVGWSMG